MLIGHLPGIAAAMSGKRLDPSIDPKELYILAKHADFFKFRHLPWTFWILSFFIFSFSCFVLYYLIFVFKERHIMYSLLNIFTFWISFVIVYAGKIETLLVDRKNNIIKLTYLNIFCSKEEKIFKLDSLKKILMVYKGHESRSNDGRRYFLRLKFKDNEKIEFGECLSYRKIERKYQQAMAIMKGELLEKVDKALLHDKTTSYVYDEKLEDLDDEYDLVYNKQKYE